MQGWAAGLSQLDAGALGLVTSVCTEGRAGEAFGVLRGCLGFLQTSTYQVILTTDGNRSFALLLYQDGGMRWDYTKLAASNVLIGFSRYGAHV